MGVGNVLVTPIDVAYDFTAFRGAQTPPYGSSAPTGSHLTRILPLGLSHPTL